MNSFFGKQNVNVLITIIHTVLVVFLLYICRYAFSLEKDDISFSLPTHLSVQQVEEDKDAEEEDEVGLVVEFRPQTISKALRLCEHDQNSLLVTPGAHCLCRHNGKARISS